MSLGFWSALIFLMLPSGCERANEPRYLRNQRYVRAFVMRFAGDFDEAKYRTSGQQFVDDLKAKLSAEGYLSKDAYGREMMLEIDVSRKLMRAWSSGANGVDEAGQGDDYLVETPYFE
jgi:hypothetical protein